MRLEALAEAKGGQVLTIAAEVRDVARHRPDAARVLDQITDASRPAHRS